MKTETNNLVEHQKEAVVLAKEYASHKTSIVTVAARCGKELTEVKKVLTHGKFKPWVEQNMPVKIRQCQKFMKLYKGKPEYASNTHLNALLDIDSELKMLSVDDDIEQKIRKAAQEDDLSQVEIIALISGLGDEAQDSDVAAKTSKPTKSLTSKAYVRTVRKAMSAIKQANKTGINSPKKPEKWQSLVDQMETALETIEGAILTYEKDLDEKNNAKKEARVRN